MPSAGVLRRGLGSTWRLLLKELSAFGVVGGACFVLDVGLFHLLYTRTGLDAVPAKAASTVVAMSVAYVAHRNWSFAHRARTGVRREYLLFAAINGATLLLSLTLVAFVRHGLGQQDAVVLQVVNVASIAMGTVLRFVSYRRWVFPATPQPQPAPPPSPLPPPPSSPQSSPWPHGSQAPRRRDRSEAGPG
ncbi:GtrA family protein [Modestobacter sp. SYSU DS0511]